MHMALLHGVNCQDIHMQGMHMSLVLCVVCSAGTAPVIQATEQGTPMFAFKGAGTPQELLPSQISYKACTCPNEVAAHVYDTQQLDSRGGSA